MGRIPNGVPLPAALIVQALHGGRTFPDSFVSIMSGTTCPVQGTGTVLDLCWHMTARGLTDRAGYEVTEVVTLRLVWMWPATWMQAAPPRKEQLEAFASWWNKS